MQLLLALGVLLQLAASASCLNLFSNVGNMIVQGLRRPGDMLLFEYRLARLPRAFQVLSESVTYPMTPGQRAGTITLVEISSPRQQNDEIKVTGGVGERYVQISFESAFNHGLDYTIRLYGMPPGNSPPQAIQARTPDRSTVDPKDDGSQYVAESMWVESGLYVAAGTPTSPADRDVTDASNESGGSASTNAN